MNQRETRILVVSWLLAAVLIVGVVLVVTDGNDAVATSIGTTLPPTATAVEETTTTAPTETTVTSSPDTTTTVPEETTTTLGSTTTTAPDGTTTTAPGATTTTAPDGTTTSTTATTSTSTPPTEDLVLEDDGIGGVSFGETPADTIAFATTALGAPANDSGWVDSDSDYGTCPRPEVRGVEWGTSSDTGYGFVLLFTKAGTSYQPAGVEHFFGYYYVNGQDPAGLKTAEGLTIGTSVGDAEAAYTDFEIGESPFDPLEGAWSIDSDPSADSLLWGIADGVDSTDSITTVNGGITCAP